MTDPKNYFARPIFFEQSAALIVSNRKSSSIGIAQEN
jgi:hypothetical protein